MHDDDHAKPAAALFTWSESLDGLNWRDVETLYRLAPLGNKSAAHLQTVFTNSRFRCFAFDAGTLIAAGRALSDGADCSYLCDVAVLPHYQGHGLGKQVVARLVQQSRGHKKIILYAVPGKEAFYRKLGFERMLTAMAIFEDQAGAFERGYLGKN
jgi:GNAT superfamily N-acetyltransferase